MPRKLIKKTRQIKAIKNYVKKGYSANRIQRQLKKRNLGIRRSTLLAKLRSIKKQQKTLAERQKYIPRKYRGKIAPMPKVKINEIYRACVVMNNVPVTSRPFHRNYLGFRICGFYTDSGYLMSQVDRLKEILYSEIERFLGYKRGVWWWDAEIGIEYPNAVMLHNVNFLNGRWIFRVEKEGKEIRENSGIL